MAASPESSWQVVITLSAARGLPKPTPSSSPVVAAVQAVVQLLAALLQRVLALLRQVLTPKDVSFS